MTKIFLIRHGEAEGNLYRRCQGQTDMPLSATGLAQAKTLAPRFADTALDAAYASDLRRALATVRCALGERALEIKADPRLREMSFGAWENRPWGEIDYYYPVQKRLFLTNMAAVSVPGMEPPEEVQRRYYQALTDIAGSHPGRQVAVGGHGMAMRLFLAFIRGIPLSEITRVTLPDNTGVTELLWEDGVFTVTRENDTSHLPTPPKKTLRAIPGQGERGWDLRFAAYDMAHGREAYLRCYEDAWRIAHGSDRGFDPAACWQMAQRFRAEDPRAVRAALRGEELAGLLSLDTRRGAEKGILWIAFLYAVPEVRGHGCGTQLLGEAVVSARRLGRSALRLSVAPENPALHFYEHLGFQRVDSQPGALGALWVMEKRV